MKFYLKSKTGKLTQVAAPGVNGSSGIKYYPVNHGGTVLWPVVQSGKLLRYSTYISGAEVPVLVPSGI